MHKYSLTSVNELGCKWIYMVIAASMHDSMNSFKYAHPDFTVLNAEEVKKKTFKL